MDYIEYDPPIAEPYVVRAIQFGVPWPFVQTSVALNPQSVTGRIGPGGFLLGNPPDGGYSLNFGDLLVELSNGETVHALCRADLGIYLRRVGQV